LDLPAKPVVPPAGPLGLASLQVLLQHVVQALLLLQQGVLKPEDHCGSHPKF
jgi:hypothetical protein